MVVGGLDLGGGAPVSVQAMAKADPRDPDALAREIEALRAAGAQMVRLAVPDQEAARVFGNLKRIFPSVPLVADVHFNASVALACIYEGADKLRINPGNIGGPRRLEEVALEASRAGVPIRVGVNSGSLERELLERYGGPVPQALAESALRNARLVEEAGQPDVVVSVKASSVPSTVEAYRLVAQGSDYPLHLGLTGAGPPSRGAAKSCLALGILLYQGIGDTIRVSLTADACEEVRLGRAILEALELRPPGPDLVSCPTCGRCRVDLKGLVAQVEPLLVEVGIPLKVAVMGCEVNGPGEAREADVGLAAGKGRGAIFRKGRIVRTVPEEEFLPALRREMEALALERGVSPQS
jgi:(E)-4-hydroxy-3-methylbut-2-enyl-diphosphate synthase